MLTPQVQCAQFRIIWKDILLHLILTEILLNLYLNYTIENAVELFCSLKEKIVIFFKLCSYRNLDAEDPPDPQLMRLDNMLIGSDFHFYLNLLTTF